MRNIVEQTRLCINQVLNSLSHAIEVAHQFRQLVSAAGTKRTCARSEIAFCQALGRSPQTHHWCGDIAGKEETNQARRQDREQDSHPRRSVRHKEKMRRDRTFKNQNVVLPARSYDRLRDPAVSSQPTPKAGSLGTIALG